jgi:dUTP pyrophosphatase
MLVFSRSGAGLVRDTRLANCVGVIDSDYRGEVFVRLSRDMAPSEHLIVHEGDRIAQAMVLPVHQVEFEVADELSATERGEGGLGSTGA